MNKVRSHRLSDETVEKLTKLAIQEALIEGKQVSNTQMLKNLINKAYALIRK